MHTKGEGVQAASAAIGSYQQQAHELGAEQTAIHASRDAVVAGINNVLEQAAQQLLPTASAEDLTAAGRETGLSHLPQRRAEYEQKRAQWGARLAQIEADPNFVNREAILHPTEGSVARELGQCQHSSAQWQAHLQKFEIEPFQWLQNRKIQREMGQGAFSSFMDTVTFGGLREDKAKKRCVSTLGYQSWDQLIADHDHGHAQLGQLSARTEQLGAYRAQVETLVQEHGDLWQWVHDFENRLLDVLRKELVEHLGRSDLRAIHRHVRPSARKLISGAYAMMCKVGYLGAMGAYLGREIEDRHRRVQSIETVRNKWAVKPHEYLTGDKSKWLVMVPHMKHEGTRKRLRWTRRMHRNVYEYDDFDDFDDYLWYDDDLFPYDAFAHGSDEPMPHEGFSKEVLPEIAEYRHAHGQEKADYSAFKEVDRKGGSLDENRLAEEYDQSAQDDAGAQAAAAVVAADHAMDMADAS